MGQDPQEIAASVVTALGAAAWLPATAFDYNVFSQMGSQPSVMVATILAFIASYGVADTVGILDN